MMHNELIEAAGRAIEDLLTAEEGWEVGTPQLKGMCQDFARAAVSVIAPAVLEEAAKVAPARIRADACETVGQWERRAIREAIRALKTRYEP